MDPGATLRGEGTRAAIAWAWVVDGVLGGRVERVDFEPRVYAYALSLDHPPEPGGDGVPAPPSLDVGVDMLWGVPLLGEPGPDGHLDVTLDPALLVDWLLGDADRPGLGGDVAAFTPSHALMALDAVEPLADLPEWAVGGEACALDGMVAGLTLYRLDVAGCEGWRALAPAGERTAFQGVPMSAY